MNRNPGRPKIIHPCTCASKYVECNCKHLGSSYWAGGYIAVMTLGISAVIIGLSYLFG